MKKSIIASSVALGLLFGGVGAANADALATSILGITNFVISDGTNPLNGDPDSGNINITYFSTTADSSSSLTGYADVIDSEQHPTDPLPLDTYTCLGDCTVHADNNFTILSHGSYPTSTYSISDTLEGGSPVANYPTSGTPAGAAVVDASYVGIVGDGSGSSTTEQTITAEWNFEVSADTQVTLSFNASMYLEAWVENTTTDVADATTAISFEIRDVTDETDPETGDGSVGVALWMPGSTDIGGTETNSNDLILNRTVSTSTNDTQAWCGAGCSFFSSGTLGQWATGTFSFTTSATLVAGRDYKLIAQMLTQADATAVPEPASLGLIGLGLLGMGMASWRRKKKLSS